MLTVLRGGYRTEIYRKIWFDRADLQVARLQAFGPKGLLLSDIHVADFQPVDNTAASNSGGGTIAEGAAAFPRTIRIERPHDDYTLDLQVTKITLNEEIPAERFKLEQPAGTELVRVGDGTEKKQP